MLVMISKLVLSVADFLKSSDSNSSFSESGEELPVRLQRRDIKGDELVIVRSITKCRI